jgi:hypothetical protein
MRKIVLPFLIVVQIVGSLSGGEASVQSLHDRGELRRLDQCQYDELFRNGTACDAPCGKTRGVVLYSEGRHPKAKARLQGMIWKGKTFRGDGTFINRWPGFEAVTASVEFGVSRFDEKPCLVMEYAPDAPVFGGVRDELREISAGVWLGRSTEAATGRFKNYFLLQAK